MPQEGEVLVRTLYLSVDPYMRGRMVDRKSYADPVKLGDVMVGEVIGVVEKSRDSTFAEGDIVRGHCGWAQYAACRANQLRRVRDGLPV